METTTTRYKLHDVVKFTKEDDPLNGVHAVITAINPIPSYFLAEEHYRIFVPGLEETYAFVYELSPKEVSIDAA